MADLTETWYDAEDLQPIQTDAQSPEEGRITIKKRRNPVAVWGATNLYLWLSYTQVWKAKIYGVTICYIPQEKQQFANSRKTLMPI